MKGHTKAGSITITFSWVASPAICRARPNYAAAKAGIHRFLPKFVGKREGHGSRGSHGQVRGALAFYRFTDMNPGH